MRITRLPSLLPTQFKRSSDLNNLRRGHYIPKLGEWSFNDGYVEKHILSYEHDAYTEVLACPIIAVVRSKFGDQDVSLTITAHTGKFHHEEEFRQEGKTLKYDVYEADSTRDVTLTIPKFTTANATFLLAGRDFYGIESVSSNLIEYGDGKVEFYALASNGAKIIYWLSMWKIAEQFKEIARPWISPALCVRCDGSGTDPDGGTCKDCGGFGYSGYSSIKYVQKQIGKDVRLGRTVLDRSWDNLTDADHKIIWKFINKCWTQKWWVTPTKSEIKRLFSHFYMVKDSAIRISERFNLQEPVWTLNLPEAGSLNSPFSTLTESDVELMKYIARTITPAGVSVFVGFYQLYEFGNLDWFDTKIRDNLFKSSGETRYSTWGTARYDYWNGWCEAIDDFEDGIDAMWTQNGTCEVINANDQGRHWARLSGTASLTYDSGISPDATIECWCHPGESDIWFGANGLNAFDGIHYDQADQAFYLHIDGSESLIRNALPHHDYHLRVSWDGVTVNAWVNKEDETSGAFVALASPEVMLMGSGTGYSWFDNYGDDWSTSYEIGDNWQRLYPYEWGQSHGSGADDYELYFRNDLPIRE